MIINNMEFKAIDTLKDLGFELVTEGDNAYCTEYGKWYMRFIRKSDDHKIILKDQRLDYFNTSGKIPFNSLFTFITPDKEELNGDALMREYTDTNVLEAVDSLIDEIYSHDYDAITAECAEE